MVNRKRKGKLPKVTVETFDGMTAAEKIAAKNEAEDRQNIMHAKDNALFEAELLTARQVAIAVYRGHPFTALFNHERKRDYAHWAGTCHICLDFDDGLMTIETLAQNSFIASFASFLHTTSSSTPDYPRVRVVFFFDKLIDSLETYQDTARGLVEKFPTCDKAATISANKIWSGAENCEVVGVWSFIPSKVSEELRQAGHVEYVPVESFDSRKIGGNYGNYVNSAVRGICDELAHLAEGARNDRLFQLAARMGELAAGNWNDLTIEEALSAMANATGDFWGQVSHRNTARKAVERGRNNPAHPPMNRSDNFNTPLGGRI